MAAASFSAMLLLMISWPSLTSLAMYSNAGIVVQGRGWSGGGWGRVQRLCFQTPAQGYGQRLQVDLHENKRLHHEIGAATHRGARSKFIVRKARHKQDRRDAIPEGLADLGAGGESIHPRQADIHEDDVELMFFRQLERFLGALGGQRLGERHLQRA